MPVSRDWSVACWSAAAVVAVAAQAPAARDVKVCVTAKRTVVASSPKGRCPKGTKRTTISRRGPAGPTGRTGARGATGATGAPGRSTAGSASELIAARLDAGAGNITMVALGEPTADESTEWWARYTRGLAAEHPDLRVVYVDWNRDSLRYNAGQVIQEGAGTQTLYSFNASRSGVSYDYHRTNFAAMFPTKPDVVYLAASHAERLLFGATYAARVQRMADTVTAKFPAAAVRRLRLEPPVPAPRVRERRRPPRPESLSSGCWPPATAGTTCRGWRPSALSATAGSPSSSPRTACTQTQEVRTAPAAAPRCFADVALNAIRDKSLAPSTP